MPASSSISFSSAPPLAAIARGSHVSLVAGEEYAVEVQLPALLQGEAEHLCGAAPAALRGQDAVADMPAAAEQEGGEAVADLEDAGERFVLRPQSQKHGGGSVTVAVLFREPVFEIEPFGVVFDAFEPGAAGEIFAVSQKNSAVVHDLRFVRRVRSDQFQAVHKASLPLGDVRAAARRDFAAIITERPRSGNGGDMP